MGILAQGLQGPHLCAHFLPKGVYIVGLEDIQGFAGDKAVVSEGVLELLVVTDGLV